MSGYLWMEGLRDAVGERDLSPLFLLQCLGIRNERGLVALLWDSEDLEPAMVEAQVAAQFWQACFKAGEQLPTLSGRRDDRCERLVDALKAFLFFREGSPDLWDFFVWFGEA